MRLQELLEAQEDTPAARYIEKLARKHGYHPIGSGWDATVWSKDDGGSVIKILMPYGKHSHAKNAFMAFYRYCERNKGNPYLPTFGAPQKFPVGSVPFMFVTMERLDPLDGDEAEYVEILGHMAEGNASWEEADSVSNDYYPVDSKFYEDMLKGFYQTMIDMRRAPEGRGFVWDLHGENAMRRGNTLVITDPWVYDTRKR